MNAPLYERPDHLFKPGHVPSNKGRIGHKNARAKLANMVFTDVQKCWDDIGEAFLRRLAFHDYAAFAQFVAKILPQRLEVEHTTPLDDIDETLLAISLKLSKAIAYLPAEDRELLDMLLTKGENLASQKKVGGEKDLEGAGGKGDESFVGEKGPPLPPYATSPDHQKAFPAKADTPKLQITRAADYVGVSASALPIVDAEYEDVPLDE